MSKLPLKYAWLDQEPGPKVLKEALRHYGVLEIPGPKSSKRILEWATELGLKNIYTTDSIPWCGLFAAICCKRSGYGVETEYPGKRLPITYREALWARNWSRVGISVAVAELGDILVFSRQAGGHVGFYIGHSKKYYFVLAGNQQDCVEIMRIPKDRCIAVRRLPYNNKPANVRPIELEDTGEVFNNAA